MIKNKILKNIVSYSFGNIISKVLIFVFGIIAARTYGAAIYGQYNYAVSVVSYFVMFANMGIQSYAVYYISRKPQELNRFYSRVLSTEICFSIISILLLLVFVKIVPKNSIMIVLVGTNIMLSALNIDWVFKAKQNFKSVSIQVCIIGFIQCFIVFFAYILKNNNWFILPLSVSIAQLVGNIFLIIIGHRDYNVKLHPTSLEWLTLVKNGLPFLFSGIFAGINCNIDIIFLGNMVTDSAVGCYSAAYKVINILTLMVSIIFTPIYPAMVEKFSKKEHNDINRLVCNVFRTLLIFIIPVAIGGIIIGDRLVIFLYGAEYSGTATVFRILLVYTVIFYVREVYGYILSASGNQKKYMLITCVSAAINIVSNLVMIPVWGIEGAALATVLSEIVSYILMKVLSSKIIKVKMKDLQLSKLIIAAVIMGLFTFLTSCFEISIIFVVGISAVIYFMILYFVKIRIKI